MMVLSRGRDAAIATFIAITLPVLGACSDQSPPSIETRSGPVIGEDAGDLKIYRNIPYAEPPVGDLRFRPPVPVSVWTQPLDATRFGPACTQPNGTNALQSFDVLDEDCLTLNIWAHADFQSRPVMVYLHGGGFVNGSSISPVFESSRLARDTGALVVTFNYRLNAFGFLALPELQTESKDGSMSNYGVRDQVLALEWVQENIAAFGGDPTRVTIFGESAGGFSVCLHLGLEASRGLFSKAIIQSGGGCYGLPGPTTDGLWGTAALSTGEHLVAATRCADTPDRLTCLRELPSDEITAAVETLPPNALGLLSAVPTYDGVFLTGPTIDKARDGTDVDVPLITGSNADEYTLFTSFTLSISTLADYDAWIDAVAPTPADADILRNLYPAASYPTPAAAIDELGADLIFVCPTLAFAEAASNGETARVYHLSHPSLGTLGFLGAFHGHDVGLVFGAGDSGGVLGLHPDEESLGAMMREAWGSFAANGTPLLPGGWPSFTAADPQIAILDDTVTVASTIRDGRCEALVAAGLIP